MANYIMDFVNNTEPPKIDGVTVYKINAKTYHRVEVGQMINGVLKLNTPKKSLSEINRKDINTYYLEFRVYSMDSSGKHSSKINKNIIDELLVGSYSIGYFYNTNIFLNSGSVEFVFWDQYD